MDDSQHLLLEYFDTIHNSPSQIYHSALPFSPSSSWLCTYYSAELIQKVKVVKGLPAEWGECFRTVRLTASPWAFVCWKDMIAAGCHTGEITILDGVIGSQTAVLSGHTQGVRCLTFSSDGKSLVSGSEDTTVKLWDVQTGGVVKTFHGHIDKVLSVSASIDHTVMASGSLDKTIRLWDMKTKECHHVIEQQEEVHYVSFSPMDSQHFISTSGGEVQQWNISDHKINSTHDGSHVTFSMGEVKLVLCQWAVAVVQHFDSRQLSSCCCLFPGSSLAAFAAGCAINIWDITGSNPHLVKTFVGHTKNISSLTFSSPSSLISSSYDETIRFWQIGDLLMAPVVANQQPTPPTLAPIKSITLQAKDGIAISGDSNGLVKVWDVSTGHCRASFQTPAKDYNIGASQLVNGQLIFVWHIGEKIHIWDMEKGEVQGVDAPWGDIEDVRISEDGSRVFFLRWECIQAWSIPTGEFVGEAEVGYSLPHRSLTVDGSRVWVHSPIEELQGWDFGISGSPPLQLSIIPPPHSNDNTLWVNDPPGIRNVATGKVVFQLGGRFARPMYPEWDGQYLAAGYESGEVLILDFDHVVL